MSQQHPRDVARLLATAAGIVIVIVLFVGGMAVIAACILFAVGMSNFGSNK